MYATNDSCDPPLSECDYRETSFNFASITVNCFTTNHWKEEWKNDQNQLEGIRGNRIMIWEEYFDACWLLSKMFLKRLIRIDTGNWLNDNWAGWMVYLYSVCILDLTDFLSSFQYRWNASIPCSIPRVYSLVRNSFQIETFFPDRLKGCWAFNILI